MNTPRDKVQKLTHIFVLFRKVYMVPPSQSDCKVKSSCFFFFANIRGISVELACDNTAFVLYVEFEIEILDEFWNDYFKVSEDFLNTGNGKANGAFQ